MTTQISVETLSPITHNQIPLLPLNCWLNFMEQNQ